MTSAKQFDLILKKIAQAPSVIPRAPFRGTRRYQIIRRLGSGGFGVVYEAFDRHTETRIALKTLHQMGPHSIKHLKKEFRSLQDLVHPNLCALGELIEEQGQWFFTMELLEGADFVSYCRNIEPQEGTSAGFAENRLRSATKQLATALATLHEFGKIHRDVKPSNVFVTNKGRTVVLDFGLVTDASHLASNTTLSTGGTVAYMAPEQAEGQIVDHKADCYAMGALLFEVLTGQLPFTGTVKEIRDQKCSREAPRPSSLNPDVPPDLDSLCEELLQMDRNRRPSARAVLTRLTTRDSNCPCDNEILSQKNGVFVGRDEELRTLDEAFVASAHGKSTLVLIEGESGIGKTALVKHFSKRLTRRSPNALLLKGRCYERESVPYKALDGVMDALANYLGSLPSSEAGKLLPPNAALIPRVFPVLGTASSIKMAPEPARIAKDPYERRRRAFQALRNLVELLGKKHNLVLVIDDLQWSDKDSWTLLSDLLRGPNSPRLLLIMLSRPSPTTNKTDFLKDLNGWIQLKHIVLGPLKRQNAAELAETLIREGNCLPRKLAEDIATEAEGHPLYIGELIRHGLTGDNPQKRPELDEAILQRIGRLSSVEKQLLESTCLAGRPISPDILQKATGMDSREFWRCLTNLRAANLVRTAGAKEDIRVEPYHERVRQAILLHISKRNATEIHSRLAFAWREAGAPVEWLLAHFEDGAELALAADCALDAAVRASKALAFDRAAELYERALGFQIGRPETIEEMELGLAAAYANAGRGPEAAYLFRQVASKATRQLRHNCLRQAAEQWLVSGHIDKGLQTLEQLFDETGDAHPPKPVFSFLLLLINRFRILLRGYHFPENQAPKDYAKITRLEAYEAVTRGFGMVDFIRAADYQARALLMALETGDRLRIGKALAYAAPFLGSPGGRGHGRARKFLREARRIADEENNEYLTGITESIEGFLTLHEGKLAKAARILARAEDTLRFETTGTAWELASTRVTRLLALRMQGDFPQVKRLFDDYIRDAVRRGDRFTETTVRRMCVRLWMVEDNPEEARRQLEKSEWVDTTYGAHLQHFLELEALVDISLYEGTLAEDLEKILPIYQGIRHSMWFRVKMVRSETNSLWGRLWLSLAARGHHRERALRKAARCAKALQREKMGYVQVLSLVLTAGIASLSEDRETTIRELEKTVSLAKVEKMDHVRGAAYHHLARLKGSDEGEVCRAKAAEILGDLGVTRLDAFSNMLIPGVWPD